MGGDHNRGAAQEGRPGRNRRLGNEAPGSNHLYTQTDIYVCMYIYTFIYKRYTYIHIYIYICIHVYVRIYIYIDIYIDD